MAAAEKYAEWIVANQAKKGTPEFETVVQAYKAARAGQSAPEPEEKPPATEPTDWLREAALGGKALFKGVASLPMAFADFQDLPKSVASKITGQPYQAPSERLGAAIDQYTYSPRDQNERLASDTIEGVSGGIVGGPGKVGLNMLAGGAGGLAAGAAREGGGGPIAQIVAAILASAGVGGATRAGKIGAEIVDAAVVPGGGKRSAVRATANIVSDREAVADALMRAKKGQTAAQAAAGTGDAELAAIERIARENAPTRFQAVDDAQQASRAARIGDIAKTPEALSAAKAARESQAKVAYGESSKVVSKADSEFADLLSRPSMSRVMKRADELASEQGKQLKVGVNKPEEVIPGLIVDESGEALSKTVIPATSEKWSGESLHYMKMAMDDLIKNPERFGIGAKEAQAIGDTQRQFIKWIEKNNPAYALARTGYRDASKPINKMVVGASLEKALTSGTGKERATTFTNAVENAQRIPELQNRSGANRFGSITDVLDDAEMAKVRGVADEFRTDARVDELMRAGSPKVAKLYKGELEKVTLPQMLTRPVMIASAILRRAQGYGSQRTTDALSDYMSPETVREFGRALKDYSKDDIRKLIVEAIMAGSAGGIAAGRE